MQMDIFHTKSKLSNSNRILLALERAGHYGLTNFELAKICISWHRRIGDLRSRGYNIRTDRLTKGSFRYTLEK